MEKSIFKDRDGVVGKFDDHEQKMLVADIISTIPDSEPTSVAPFKSISDFCGTVYGSKILRRQVQLREKRAASGAAAKLMRNRLKMPPQLRRIQSRLLKFPRYHLDQIHLCDLSLEDFVLKLAATLHKIWLRYNEPRLQDPNYQEHFRHLPLFFIGWTETSKYIKNILEVMSCFDAIEISESDIEPVYQTTAALTFFQLGLDKDPVPNLARVVLALAARDQTDNYEWLAEEQAERIEQQIADRGIGSMKLIQNYARVVGLSLSNGKDEKMLLPSELERQVSKKVLNEIPLILTAFHQLMEG